MFSLFLLNGLAIEKGKLGDLMDLIVRLHLCLLCGAGGYPPNVLQPFETYCTNPALVSPFISRGAPRQPSWETSSSERWNYEREMSDQI
jgi:hypothetical protein